MVKCCQCDVLDFHPSVIILFVGISQKLDLTISRNIKYPGKKGETGEIS